MRIIDPYFEILSPISESVLKLLEVAGRTCYKSEDKITAESERTFVRKVISSGHESVIEHASMTVKFICDRGVSHEIVRHRIASFSQESTRYCNYTSGKFDGQITVILPPWVKGITCREYPIEWDGLYGQTNLGPVEHIGKTEGDSWWFWACALAERDYRKLIEHGWKPEQARSVLPNSLKTEIVVTANIREWRHILKLRCSEKAHPQMRQLMIPLRNEMILKNPELFDDIIKEQSK